MFTFMFSEGTSVRNFLFISNSEADVPELFLVVRRINMAKYRLLLSSLHFGRVFFVAEWLSPETHYSEGTRDWKSCV